MLDETKFRQIVTNLIKNGLYHRSKALNIQLQKKANQLLLTVQDDGPGVAFEHHQLVFEQYKQIDPLPDISRSGHGLGLAGAQILARCLGGDIELDSQKGQGAVFCVTLPIFPNAN
jgi:signal transduction histidine kinase